MKARAGSGWQTLLADLSIILFMVTAAALSHSGPLLAGAGQTPSPPAITPQAIPAPSTRSEPLAIYRAGPGAPPLAAWLAAQSVDTRQQLTIVAHYTSAGQAAAMSGASALLLQAGKAGVRARLVVEPGEGGIVATLAYDTALAQGLHDMGGNKSDWIEM
jgi:hypothetical protein